jgi:hypothetical protein
LDEREEGNFLKGLIDNIQLKTKKVNLLIKIITPLIVVNFNYYYIYSYSLRPGGCGQIRPKDKVLPANL